MKVIIFTSLFISAIVLLFGLIRWYRIEIKEYVDKEQELNIDDLIN